MIDVREWQRAAVREHIDVAQPAVAKEPQKTTNNIAAVIDDLAEISTSLDGPGA